MTSGALLQGGTIVDSGGVFIPGGGTLQNVAYQGTLDLSGNNAALNVIGSMAFASVNGQNPGTVLLTGSASALTVIGTGTLSNATIDIGDSAPKVTDFNSLTSADNGSGGVLTLASTTSLVQTGTYAWLGDSGGSGDGVVNLGTIRRRRRRQLRQLHRRRRELREPGRDHRRQRRLDGRERCGVQQRRGR